MFFILSSKVLGTFLCIKCSHKDALSFFSLCGVSYRVGAWPFHHVEVEGRVRGVEPVKVFASVITQRCFPVCVCLSACVWEGYG